MRGEEEFLHVLSANSEAPTSYAGNNFVLVRTFGLALSAEVAEMLHTSDFVPGRAVILRNFRLDNELRVELVWDDKVGSLVETRNLFSSFGFSVADSRISERFLDSDFKAITNQLRY